MVVGTVIVSCVAVAAVTVAAAPSIVTALDAAVVLKPEPVIVAVMPGVSSAGDTALNGSVPDTTAVAVAVNVTGLPDRPAAVAVRLFAPAAEPNVHPPTVATPLLFVV